MHIVGTAGHVDHGKSALIAALTGTNPDRLVEEQRRGMTLDLGFAHLQFDDGVEAGVVDVPGHERFLHNMLAGAAGIEILLLVVDAHEGVKAQTLEHLQIMQFLNVRRVIVAASKIDLIESDERDGALERVRRELQGTIAASAPMYPVSAIAGIGTNELKAGLHDELAALPPRNLNAPAYLPIDRVFTLPGLGTVVTGTLMQGRITVGETLVVEPGGTPAHVRSIGVFESTRTSAEAGSRVALNLSGVDRCEIGRGQAIVGHEFSARRDFAVRFVPLQSARSLIRRRTPVRAYIGSAEILGTLIAEHDAPGLHEMRAKLHLREPVVGFPGLRFVVRRPSPMSLLGGGHVEGLDVADSGEKRGSNDDLALAILARRGIEPVQPSAVAVAANIREDAAGEALERLADRGKAIRVARPPAYVDAGAAQQLVNSVNAQLEEAQRREPWSMGMTSLALARATGIPESTLVRIAEHYVAEGSLVNRAGYFATIQHQPLLAPQQRAFFEHLLPVDEEQPFVPIPFAGAVGAVKQSQIPGLSKALDMLLVRGELVKVGDDLYRGSQISRIRARVEAHFRANIRMSAAEFRDMLGTSRKYAVPLLEWLDGHGVTIRNGDYRSLRPHTSAPLRNTVDTA
ncbi:MAG: selenocysteine-specific translation elongation factor [Candidatus Eremiobacteraeota bacterium]|nr:selenocysteine-specific translation elongation factor [Candidatus Eremiobacteraeota bacterium]